MPSTISPEHVLREMSDLWLSLAKQPEGDPSAGVLRSCTLTLIVACDESEDPQSIGETLAALMPENPSRAIVIRLRNDPEPWLAARVFAQCWMPFGHRTQICCEQIEITGAEASLADLPVVLLPLVAPDLPVVLWCRSARLFELPELAGLARLAHKIVVDSAGCADPRAALKLLLALSRSGYALGDFAWTRITRWRELVAQVFENRAYLASLPDVSDVVISTGGKAPGISGWYLAAWLTDGLAKAGSKAAVRFEANQTGDGDEIHRVEMRTSKGDTLHVTVESPDGNCMEVRVDSMVNRTGFPQPSDYLLMREELAIPDHDVVYERALAGAVKLAG